MILDCVCVCVYVCVRVSGIQRAGIFFIVVFQPQVVPDMGSFLYCGMMGLQPLEGTCYIMRLKLVG